MNIIADCDKNLNFEFNSSWRKLFNFFLVPILNILPPSSRKLIRKSHRSVDEIIEHATSHHALEILYQKGHAHHTKSITEKLTHWIWFNTNNSKAVRNRIRIVKREIIKSITSQIKIKEKISLLSIASGSARAIIESIHKLRKELHDVKLNVYFLDKEDLALQYSKNLLTSYSPHELNNSNHSFFWIKDQANSYLSKCLDNQFDIIEMVGLLDYFDDNEAKITFSKIFQVLSVGGIFITANIDDNVERRFITQAIGWKMIYRSAHSLAILLMQSGFLNKNIEIYYEPLKIHSVAIARK